MSAKKYVNEALIYWSKETNGLLKPDIHLQNKSRSEAALAQEVTIMHRLDSGQCFADGKVSIKRKQMLVRYVWVLEVTAASHASSQA